MNPLPARLYTLGPEGTFSDKAARRYQAHLHREQPQAAPEIVFTRTIPEVLNHTEDDPLALGIFPIENSDTGTVVFAQDALVNHQVTIVGEIDIPVRFSLLANAPLEQVRTVLSQPVAYDQCSFYLADHLAQADVTFTTSNTESGRAFLARDAAQPTAAIVPAEFGEEHAAHCVATDIQNYEQNVTRFLVVRALTQGETRDAAADTIAGQHEDFRHGKTSLLVEPQEDRPGLLYDLLSVFNRHRLNLVRLESRPAKIRPWTYVFFLDFHNNAHTADCLAELRNGSTGITVLGSYDTLE